MDPDTFALPAVADSTVPRGAVYASVRKASNGRAVEAVKAPMRHTARRIRRKGRVGGD